MAKEIEAEGAIFIDGSEVGEAWVGGGGGGVRAGEELARSDVGKDEHAPEAIACASDGGIRAGGDAEVDRLEGACEVGGAEDAGGCKMQKPAAQMGGYGEGALDGVGFFGEVFLPGG